MKAGIRRKTTLPSTLLSVPLKKHAMSILRAIQLSHHKSLKSSRSRVSRSQSRSHGPTTQPLRSAGLSERFSGWYNWHQEAPTSFFVNIYIIGREKKFGRRRAFLTVLRPNFFLAGLDFFSPALTAPGSQRMSRWYINSTILNLKGPGYNVDGHHNVPYIKYQATVNGTVCFELLAAKIKILL